MLGVRYPEIPGGRSGDPWGAGGDPVGVHEADTTRRWEAAGPGRRDYDMGAIVQVQ